MQLSTEKNPTMHRLVEEESTFVVEDEKDTAGTAELTENIVPIVHKWFKEDDIRQKYVQYAYKLGGMDFVTTLECENGNWSLKAVWDGWKAFGLCQMNTRFHKLPEWYMDIRQVQVEYCYQKWSTWTRYYWPDRKIKWQKCKDYVLDRFIINDENMA